MATRRQERGDAIARSAVAPLSERGMRNVTLSDLGASVGMSGAHLLYYFDSKADIFAAALRVVEQDLRKRAETVLAGLPSARERWEWLVDAGAPTGLDDSGLLLWLDAWAEAVHSNEVHALITDLEESWQTLLRTTLTDAVAGGELPAGLDTDLIVEGVSSLLDGLSLRVVVGYRPLDHAGAMAVVRRFTAPLLPWREPPGQGTA
jgi:AcrR family transcriptional regulator